MYLLVLEFTSLFLAGLLAGEEFVICYGVRGPLGALGEGPQIQLRQALIRRLRVLVPALFGLTAALGIARAALGGEGPAVGVRCVGLLALLTFFLITMLGTVPINKGVLNWREGAIPGDWRALVRRWEQLDVARCWAAILAFGFFLTAAAVERAGKW